MATLSVTSSDDTSVLVISGGLGAGFVGVGASVGVLVISKDTQAFIADGATVDAKGTTGGGTEGVLDGTFDDPTDPADFDTATRHGVVVQAESSETIKHFSVAAGGGFVGVSGAIDVSVVGSDTLAWIGNADINQTGDNAGAASAQGVYVGAADKAEVTAFAGAISGGFVGAAGAVNVGVLKNNVNAQIRNGAVVTAKGDVQVNALGIKDIDSYTFSGAGGFVGGAGSVSVFSVGDSLSDSYKRLVRRREQGPVRQRAAERQAGRRHGQRRPRRCLPGRRGFGHGRQPVRRAWLLGLGQQPEERSAPGPVHQQCQCDPERERTQGERSPGQGSRRTTGDPRHGRHDRVGHAGHDGWLTCRSRPNENLHLNMPLGAVGIGAVGVGVAVGVVTVQSNVAATAGGDIVVRRCGFARTRSCTRTSTCSPSERSAAAWSASARRWP